MPKADENMAEGTVARWLAREGETVKDGQNVVECIADKGEFECWSEADGTLLKIFAPENSVVPVGYILAAVGRPDEEMPDVEAENRAAVAAASEQLRVEPTGTPQASPEVAEEKSPEATKKGAGAVRATPSARRLARSLSLDLRKIAEGLPANALVREKHVRDFIEKSGGKEGG